LTDTDDRTAGETALVIHPIRPHGRSARTPEARLQEAVGLAEALDLEVVDAQLVTLRGISPATLFGKGRVEALGLLRQGLDASLVVVDDVLSAAQQRNLERAWNAKVLDRTGMILEIFARRARTGEGRLQVELARLEYERSRLVRTWTHLERQRGGFGFLGGPGESQIEADRRLIGERIVKLKVDLASVRRTRELQRRGRKRVPYPIVALVGYTNAGKSTLFNRLTHAGVLARSMLFATLDPTLRRLGLPGGRDAILSDTVGFISDLPHELVEAFRATLDEVREADLILHVRDIASHDSDAQRLDVEKVLEELGLGAGSGRRILEVWNKVDLTPPEERADLKARASAAGSVVVSAETGEGCEELLAAIADRLDESPERTFQLSDGDGEALAWLYRHGRVTERREGENRLTITAKLDPQALGQFERLRPQAAAG
jgi:GTP-binding protein HflX